MDYKLIGNEFDLYKSIDILSESPIIAVDTETTGLSIFDNEVLLIQISNSKQTFVYDCRKLNNISLLNTVLFDTNIIKIFHNAKFDYKFLKYKYNININLIYDTFIAEQVIQSGIKKFGFSLKDLIQKYLSIEIDKSERSSFIGFEGEFNEKQIEYAVKDVLYLFEIYNKQISKINQLKLNNIIYIENKLIPILAEMEIAGINVDKKNWLLLIEKYKNRVKEKEKEIKNYISSKDVMNKDFNQFDLLSSKIEIDINLNSNKQLLEILKKLLYEIKSTSSKELEKYSTDKLISKILDYRQYQKVVSSFGSNFIDKINKKTNRIHCEFWQTSTESGRLISRNPNLQQIPNTEEFRKLFIPNPGNLLVDADYSQAELRILAEFSQDRNMIEAINSGQDLHKATASMMFGIDVSEVDKQKRSAAKAINFGLVYGRGVKSLADQLDLSYIEAKKLIDRYFSIYSGVKYWIEKQKKIGLKTLSCRTIAGRLRRFKINKKEVDIDKQRASIERQAVNTPIQGSNADITKEALIILSNKLINKNAKIVNCIHDEILIECDKLISKEVSEIVKESMLSASNKYLKSVKMAVDCVVSEHWEH